MNAEEELVFAKYLVTSRLADAQAVKRCLRAQALRSSEGDRVSLASVLLEQRVLEEATLHEHMALFDARRARCERCEALWYRPQGERGELCPRCIVGGSSKTGLTGLLRRAQQGESSEGALGPSGARPAGAAADRLPPASSESRRSGAHAPVDQPEPQGPLRFGDYEVIEAIARGGMGVVYKARHREMGRVVALKVLREAQRQSESHVRRFKREARAVARLVHANIVQIHEFGQEGEQWFFTMDFVEGPSLDRFLADPERDPRRGVEILRDVARGIACAHSHGIVHRDVKPANVLLDESGVAKVTDFGLARSAEHESALTQEGELIGTPLYMSPEQVRGRVHEIDERSDTYSLGVILYQHLTGKLPFLAQTMVDLQYRIVHDEVPSIRNLNPKVDPALETIVLKCLEKDRGARYQTAQELAEDLDRWLTGKRIVARAPSIQGRIVRRLRRHRHVTVTVALVVLGLGVGGALLGWREWRAREGEQVALRARVADELQSEARSLLRQAEWTLDQASTELRRGAAVDARGAVERAKIQLDDLAALAAPELDPAEVRAIKEAAGLSAMRRRWLLVAARADVAYRTAESLERAEQSLASLVAASPQDAETWLFYAEVLVARGRLADADEAIARVLALDPERPGARAMRGRIALAREHWADAEAELTRALEALVAAADPESRSENAALLLGRASARRQLGRLDDAEADAAAAVQLAPQEPRAHVELAQIAERRGERFRAAALYDRAVDLADDEDTAPRLARARFLIDQGHFARANKDVDACLAVNDALVEGYLFRGIVLYHELELAKRGSSGRERGVAEGHLDRVAEADLQRVAERVGVEAAHAALAWRWIGRVRRAWGRSRESVAAYQQALALEPSDEDALVGLARAALDAGEADLAERALADAARLGPSSATLTALGLLALTRGDARAALGHLDRAVETAPGSLEPLAARARAHAALGNRPLADRDHRAALTGRVEASDVRRHFQQGRKSLALAERPDATHLVRTQELEQAEQAFLLCVRLVPLHARAHVELARVYEHLGDRPGARASALDACGAALEANPQAVEGYLVRARLRMQTSGAEALDAAEADLRAALALLGDGAAEAHRLLARVLLAGARTEEALAAAEAAVRLAPGDLRAFEVYAEALRAAGRGADAQRAAERAQALRAGGLRVEVKALVDRAEQVLIGDPRAAARLLTQAIALEPGSGELFYQRHLAHLFAIDRQAAIRDLARAMELEPAQVDRMCVRLSELTHLIQWDEIFGALGVEAPAEAPAGAASASAPSPAFLRGVLYVLRVESGAGAGDDAGALDARRGVDAFTEVLEQEPTLASAYCLRGLLLLRANDLEAAQADLKDAQSLDRELSAAHVYLAGVLSQRGVLDLALWTLNRAIELGYADSVQLARDPALAPLRRRTEDWQRLLERAARARSGS